MSSRVFNMPILSAFVLFTTSIFAQSTKAPAGFDIVEIHAAKPGSAATTFGILPNGRIYFQDVSPRAIIAAAYGLNEDMVSGGPAWLDSDRLDLLAHSAPIASQQDHLSMLRALLAERFKLIIHHDPKPDPVYVLTVAKEVPRLKPATAPGSHLFRTTSGDPKQIHIACEGFSMAELADLLPEIAPAYLSSRVVDNTGLPGSFDFQIDWMGRRAYDPNMSAVSAGTAK